MVAYCKVPCRAVRFFCKNKKKTHVRNQYQEAVPAGRRQTRRLTASWHRSSDTFPGATLRPNKEPCGGQAIFVVEAAIFAIMSDLLVTTIYYF